GILLAWDGFSPSSHLLRTNITNVTGPGPAIFNPAISIATTPYSVTATNARQPDGSVNLENGDPRIGSVTYHVRTHSWAAHDVDIVFGTTHFSAIRWYEIDAMTSAILQSGTLSEPHHDYIYPSIAANALDEVVIGFTRVGDSTTTDFPSAYAVAGM